MYRQLDPAQIIATARTLSNRIAERFPGSGLAHVSIELLEVAKESHASIERMSRPYWPLRLLAYRMIERVKPEENRLTVELKAGEPVAPLLGVVGDVMHFELTEELDRRVVLLELPGIDEELIGRISELDYVIGVRWQR